MATETSVPDTDRHQKPDRKSDQRREISYENEITVLELLIVLAERKKTILLTAGAFALVAAVVSLLLPSRYTATTTILPPQQNSSIGATMVSQLGNMGGGMAALAGSSLGLKSPTDMIVAMMKSRSVEDGMVQRFGLAQEYHARFPSDARKSLRKYATIDASGKDGLIHLSFEDRDPRRAAELANGYIDEFRKLSERLAITEAGQRRLFFEQQLETAKDNLAHAEEAFKLTEQKTGLIQLDSQARALIESAAMLRAQISAKEVQIKSLETFATDQNAQLVQAQQELDSLRAQLAKLGGTEAGSETSLIVPPGKVPEAGLEYVRKYRDVKYYETVFDILARQFEIAKLDEARQGAVIQIVDTAVPPDRRSFPKRTVIVIAATFAGLFVGMILALARAYFENMNRKAENITRLMRLRQAISFRRGAVSGSPSQ